MARTKQNAGRSTGGKTPRKQLAGKAQRKYVERTTRDGNYVTTLRTWDVAKIVDRRAGDRWKASNVRDLDSFCVDDEAGQRLIAASTKGRCMFEALKVAASLAGRPDIVTDADIDAFAVETLEKFGIDIDKGTTWEVFLVFLRRLRDAGRDFIFRAISLDNFAPCGYCGVPALKKANLLDDIYLVAAYNPQFVGHCFVMKVDGQQRTVHDKGECMTVEKAEWVNFIAFIRPFIVYK
ncbi:hypothetical protein PHMEG_0007524 [Phytophthora megakarya]|uniref:Uncharacterized protein n=1 Tax=Phytophthora megakarya TaxID=4795 RepID=A0A225WL06_9STRA|nr:hypothetical protein PHMEG_0007524 [Phytophthora megakarya]